MKEQWRDGNAISIVARSYFVMALSYCEKTTLSKKTVQGSHGCAVIVSNYKIAHQRKEVKEFPWLLFLCPIYCTYRNSARKEPHPPPLKGSAVLSWKVCSVICSNSWQSALWLLLLGQFFRFSFGQKGYSVANAQCLICPKAISPLLLRTIMLPSSALR